MLKNYIKISWRNIIKNRFYSVVNIAGLSAGIAFTLLIAAYAWSELQVNRELKNFGNQYILQSKWKDPNMGIAFGTLAPLPKALKEQYPNLVANFYLWDGVMSIVSKADKHFREGIQIGDSTLLSMYGFKLLHGDARTALNEPFSVVITTNIALKYFGKTDVIGQTLTIENFKGATHDFAISGVMNRPANNSVTQLNDNNNSELFLPASAARFMGRNMDAWNNNTLVGYIELQTGVTPQQLDKPLHDLLQRYAPEQFQKKPHSLSGSAKKLLPAG